MIKFLIKLGSFLVCAGILAFGGYQTVQEIKIDEMMGEIETALESTPILPDFGGNEDGEGENAGNNKPGNPDQGGSVTPDIPDQGGDVTPDNPDQGGSVTPDNPDQGGSVTPDNPNQGSGVNPDNPNQGGGVNPDNPNQGGNEGGEEPTPPQNETLSSSDAQAALGNIYDNSNPDFNDFNRELFVGMIEGFIGGGDSSEPPQTEPDPEEPDFDESFDDDFGGDFNPDDYNPDDVNPDEEGSQDEVNNIIIDVAGTYFDNLQAGIQQNQQDNAGASEEEQQAARDQFVQQESEAFAGLINIATRPEETTEEQLVNSVDAVLNSNVCLDTVTQSVERNDSLTTTVQDATANMNEETKSEIETKINEALAANPEKEQQYKDLANLFGITLGEGETPDIPEGFNPGDYNG